MQQLEDQENNIIECVFVRCKMLTNGVLRVELEFEEGKNSSDAFKTICEPMARIAVVRIKHEG